MKRSKGILFAITPALLIAINSWAHDPSEHMKNGEKADCSAMNDMDHSKTDMNDPVMQAMMQKCMHQSLEDGNDNPDAERREKTPPSTDANSNEHGHNH